MISVKKYERNNFLSLSIAELEGRDTRKLTLKSYNGGKSCSKAVELFSVNKFASRYIIQDKS